MVSAVGETGSRTRSSGRAPRNKFLFISLLIFVHRRSIPSTPFSTLLCAPPIPTIKGVIKASELPALDSDSHQTFLPLSNCFASFESSAYPYFFSRSLSSELTYRLELRRLGVDLANGANGSAEIAFGYPRN
jgi:hypothetical protein